MSEEQLHCLNCGASFGDDDVNATFTSHEDRCYVVCARCGVRNELRADRVPGLAVPPRAVVVRTVRD